MFATLLQARQISPAAGLTITDWADGGPVGPVGQEILFNFVQVQPYELER